MSKVYCHTPVKRVIRDFLSHLDIADKNKGDLEALNQDFTALILSPINETKSFRQVFPLFIKKLSKKFKLYLKKQNCDKAATFSWDEGLVIVLESLEDFLSLKWQVRFHRLESCRDPELDNFKEPIVTQGFGDEIFVSFELLTQKQENTFEFNDVAGAVEAIAQPEEDDDENTELVVEEIRANETEQDKEMEIKRQEEEDKRLEAEFVEFKKTLDEKVEELTTLQQSYQFRKVIALGNLILENLSSVKSSKREHAIYLTERKIEVSILLSTIYLGNGSPEKLVKLLLPLSPVAKKGPVDTYVDLLLLLGDAQYQLEDYEEAMKAFSQCLSTKKKFTKEMKMSINAKRAKTAIKFEEDDGIGYVNMTAEEGFKYMKYVTETAKPGEAIYSYAAASLADAMFKRGQIGQAAHTCLIALVADSTNEELRKLFVSFLQKHDQLVTAILEMFTNVDVPEEEDGKNSTASSITFVGSILKEHSAITEAETFIKKSCELTKYKQPDIILSYLQLLELSRDFSKFFIFANSFFKKTKKKAIQFKIPKNIVEGSVELKTCLDAIVSSGKYKGLVSEKEGVYSYKVSNGIFGSLIEKATEIIDMYISTADLRFERAGLPENTTPTLKQEVIKPVKIEEDADADEEVDPLLSHKYVTVEVNGELDGLSKLAKLLANSEIRESVEYDETSLQLLSIYFMVIKVLYQVCPIPQATFARSHGKNVIPHLIPVIAILEPLRVVAKDLHLTPVRNEQAYFSLIAQALQSKIDNRENFHNVLVKTSAFNYHQLKVQEELKKINPDYASEKDYRTLVEDTMDKIYVFGDSHCLSLGWQIVNKKPLDAADFNPDVDLNPAELLPVLATGVKAWHLREESTYYPKYSFYQGVQFIERHFKKFKDRQEYLFKNGNELNTTQEKLDNLLSRKPKVVLLFCEIDCREGMAMAIETGKYNSIEEAAQSVVEIYLLSVRKLLKKYSFRCFVHPVLPVLPATRPLVSVFNKILKKEVAKLQKKDNFKEDLVYLEFLDKLTTEDGAIKPEFLLDGLHLHPGYVNLFKEQFLE